ncbi:MAG TPA: ATP-dependent RecD-like DNA helicase [Myxococcota bacterium]|nr:ATP-dependent RecD-like DNA helicase [Myxococcota bacterium]
MAYGSSLDGELLRIDFTSDDGTFAVARLQTEGGEVVAIGPLAHLTPGAQLRLDGRWSEHRKYGKRFRVFGVLVQEPRTLRGLRRYLAGGAVRGIKKTLAARVVARFGLDTLRILDEEPEELLKVPGIGPKTLERIVESWERDKAGRELAVLLQGHGLGAGVAQRILDRYGERAMKVVSGQPYRLAEEVAGVGFRTADAIARAVGIAVDDPRRADAAVRFLLLEAEGEGHCFLPRGDLIGRARQLEIDRAGVDGALGRLVLEGRVVQKVSADPSLSAIYRSELDARERKVAEALARLLEEHRGQGDVRVALAESRVGLELDDEQRRAVALGLTRGVAVITGGPGTGKTTIVRVLLEAASLAKERWALAAPTGRAARRLAESCGREGKTLHRLLEYSMRKQAFLRNAGNPLEVDGVLVDEASMMDLGLTESLLSALPSGARLVLVGDADQLPSVGAGRVLGDLIASGVVPVASLSQVYRQAEDSAIVRNAWRILRGLPPVSAEKNPETALRQDFFVVKREDAIQTQVTLERVVAERLPAIGFDPVCDVQVLTPMHKGPLGSRALNELLQARLNPHGKELRRGDKRIREGDRVLQVRNDYDNDIFNGDVGRVTGVEGEALTIDFDGREVVLVGEQLDQIELAYAISIHKSQGSEYRAVVVVLSTGHHVMLRRNLIYTAVTRAREFCSIVGSPRAIGTAVRRSGGDRRFTGLADRLALSAR